MSYTKKELQHLLERETKAKLICAELNNFVDLRSSLNIIISHLKNLAATEAISIRLQNDGDYPFYVHDGFPESFITKENSLCSKDPKGTKMHCQNGEGYVLECLCGKVISGKISKNIGLFTEKGSFWSNNLTDLEKVLYDNGDIDLKRNYCSTRQGYNSIALVPIKARNEIVGLVQLCDKKENVYNLDLVEYIEMIAEQIGLAIQNALIFSQLQKALTEIKVLRGIIPICSCCKRIRDDKGFWETVEVYIRDHSEANFSHGICPECAKKVYPDLYEKAFPNPSKAAK